MTCPRFTPDVALARSRLDGFAFVGLTEEWPTSACLFALKFGIQCDALALANSRPTAYTHALNRTPPSVYRNDPALYEIFADPADMALYGFAKRRFEEDVRAHGVSRERCDSDVCPAMRMRARRRRR